MDVPDAVAHVTETQKKATANSNEKQETVAAKPYIGARWAFSGQSYRPAMAARAA